MIKYNLACKKCKKSFDSWFSSSKEYDKLKKLSLINCYNCGSIEVDKNLMSPNVLSLKNERQDKIRDKKFANIKKTIKSVPRTRLQQSECARRFIIRPFPSTGKYIQKTHTSSRIHCAKLNRKKSKRECKRVIEIKSLQ